MLPAVTLSLSPHPSTPCDFLRSVVANLGRESHSLHLRFTLTGDLARLRLPAPAVPDIADRLWTHTCGEAFVAPDLPDHPELGAYEEYNLSPSGEWAHSRFESYRQRRAGLPGDPPRIDMVHVGSVLELAAVIPLPEELHRIPLRVALSMVIEDRDDGLSYWALAHPEGQPDFHHSAGFRLHLPAVPSPAHS